MSALQLLDLPLAGLRLLRQRVHEDVRGRFTRLFCEGFLVDNGVEFSIRQINHSLTRERGTVRGLHFQFPPHAESKLISCLRGSVWDVVVDVRRGSPTFLHWHAERLEEGCASALLIPPGFAHGFQALTDDAELLYLHSADYTPNHEGGLSAHDARLAIQWPLPVRNLSDRDAGHAPLDERFEGVEL